jgi:4'-phosphopantetheinyl transferase
VDTDRLTVLALPAGVPPQVRLWRLDVEGAALRVDGLAPAEQDRCRFYRHEADRVRFAATRRMLRILLGQYLDLAPADVPLAAGAHGKPLLADGALQFNVSHAGRYAFIAVSPDAPVGVDLERIDNARPVAAIAEQFFSAEECAACRGSAAMFCQLWSCKEAVLKAWGCGIGGAALPALEGSGRDGECSAVPDDRLAHRPARVWHLAAPPGYAAALALA